MRNKKYRDRGVRAATSVYHPPLHLSLLLVHHLEVKSSWSPWSASSASSPSTPPQLAHCPSPGGQFNIITITINVNIIITILVQLVHYLDANSPSSSLAHCCAIFPCYLGTYNQRPNKQYQRLSRWAVNYTITITIIILVRLVHHLLLLQLLDQLLLRPHQRWSSHHLDDHQWWGSVCSKH